MYATMCICFCLGCDTECIYTIHITHTHSQIHFSVFVVGHLFYRWGKRTMSISSLACFYHCHVVWTLYNYLSSCFACFHYKTIFCFTSYLLLSVCWKKKSFLLLSLCLIGFSILFTIFLLWNIRVRFMSLLRSFDFSFSLCVHVQFTHSIFFFLLHKFSSCCS